jgi:PAS domain S-box-containing protein
MILGARRLGLLLLALTGFACPAQAELSFRDVFRTHVAVMLLIDPQTGAIRDANPAAARFYGYPLERLRRMRIQEINTLTPEQVRAEVKRAESGQRRHFVFSHRLASGDVRKVAVWSTPQDFGDEELLVSIVSDITEMREADDPFWHYQSGLEEKLDLQSTRIRDYVAQLRAKDRRIIAALLIGVLGLFLSSILLANDVRRRRIAEANTQRLLAENRHTKEVLERFTEVAAHHLQEPCRRMASYASLIKRRLGAPTAPAEVADLAGTLESQALRQRALVRDMQLYLAAGQARCTIGVADPTALVRELGESLAQRRAGAPVELTVAALPPIPLDRKWLLYCLRFILDNAIEHAHPDQPLAIRVSAARHQQGLQLRVADDGPGIPQAYRTRVFGVFEQLRPPQAATQTGVGLAIVQRIMESVGGRAWAEATPGGGTTIVLEFTDGGNQP